MTRLMMRFACALACLLPTLTARPARAEDCPMEIRAAIEDAGRAETNRARDPGRNPCGLLEFADIKDGDVVFELLGAQGYYTELVSQLVGEEGRVIHHNNSIVLDLTPPAQLEPLRARIAARELSNVEWFESEIEEIPLKDDSVDTITAVLALHDFYWMSRAPESAAFKELYRILKPKGRMIVVDHAALPDSGVSMAVDQNGPHRIDQRNLRAALERIGFEWIDSSDISRNPDDDRTLPFFDPSLWRDKTDRFIMKLRKPAPAGQ